MKLRLATHTGLVMFIFEPGKSEKILVRLIETPKMYVAEDQLYNLRFPKKSRDGSEPQLIVGQGINRKVSLARKVVLDRRTMLPTTAEENLEEIVRRRERLVTQLGLLEFDLLDLQRACATCQEKIGKCKKEDRALADLIWQLEDATRIKR